MDIKILALGLVGIGIKLLLIPAYYSTDFDVHHNWLRITYTKPLSEWYFDDQSKWTLDYPPFFAYFEYTLAWIASFIDPGIVKLIVTDKVVYFQRISVIITQIPFLYILYVIFDRRVCGSLIASYLFVPLTILDNIHFQYNIMLQTLFLVSVYFLVRKQNYLIAALTYSILLNFKHIYLYCSIAFFILILKNYVLKRSATIQGHNQIQQKLIRLAKVASVTLLPFFLSFAPFIIVGGVDEVKQIFSRLFPFGRGLIHDYWAPNFWAIYFFADKTLSFVLKFAFKYEPIDIKITNEHKALNCLKIFPEPSANMTLLIIIVCLVPLILHSIKVRKLNGLKIILISGLLFFMFGYHAHQKAISPYLHLSYVFMASNFGRPSHKNQGEYNSVSQSQQKESAENISGSKRFEMDQADKKCETDLVQTMCIIFFNILNLFPLLIDVKEKPLKIVIAILYFMMLKAKISDLLKKGNHLQVRFYQYLSNLCLALVFICELLIPFFNWLNGNKYEFLPLMINSASCAFVNFLWTFKFYYSQLNSAQ